MHTTIQLFNDHYTLTVVNANDEEMMTGDGPYCNFVKEINTLGDWFQTFVNRGASFTVNDFRDNTDFDPITMAKAQRAERLERERRAIEEALDPTSIVEVGKAMGINKLTVYRALRQRFGYDFVQCKEAWEA